MMGKSLSPKSSRAWLSLTFGRISVPQAARANQTVPSLLTVTCAVSEPPTVELVVD
jgi:hypothetical protein